MNKKFYLETFGCQMNVSDSEKIAFLIKEKGFSHTDNPSEADLILLNTCSVRAKAEQKLYSTLGRFKELKKNNRKLIIGIGGCVAQKEGERLLKKAPFVNIVFGTHNVHLVAEMVFAAEAGHRLSNTEFIDNETRFSLYPQTEDGGASSRFVTIMQGCDNYCSYCIVPYVRGREVSRPEHDIISEISIMAEKGVKEVTLLGQNVNSYGTKNPGLCDFPELLRKIALIEGIERIRFTTSHPKDLSPALIRCFCEMPKLCGHIHLPAQSGSDRVLARMERGYTRNEYLEKIASLKEARPDIQITGDMIVGFPGEDEDDLLQTLSLMDEVEYADLFSFIFSPRPETKAAGFEDQLTYREKQQRLSRLQTRQKEMTLARNKAIVGTVQQVLVEGVSKRGDQLFGRTDGNRIVNFAGEFSLMGKIVPVLLTKAFQNSFLGKIKQ